MHSWLLVATALLLTVPGPTAEEKDPNLWLEEVTGAKALTWVKERNAESTAELTKDPNFEKLRARMLSILDSKEKIPFVAKHGTHYYNFWRDEVHKRGLWRRTTLEEYKKTDPKWETMLDLDELAAKEKENWVWHDANWREPACDRCLVFLSRGGADAAVMREFDPHTKTFVKDGFFLPEAKSDVTWLDLDRLIVGTDFGPGSLTDSGYPRVLKEWKRGTPLASATLVYEGKKADVAVGAVRDTTTGFEREFVSRAVTFWESDFFLRRDGKLIKVEKPQDAEVSVWREWATIRLRTPWTVAGRTYASGALLVAPFEGFLKGERKLEVLFEPSDRTSLAGYSPTRNHIILNVLDNVRSRLYLVTHGEKGWATSELPGVPSFAQATAQAIDSDVSDDYWLTVEDFLSPVTLSLGTAGKGPAEKVKQAPSFYDAKGLKVEQHVATSKDGTKVPYFQIARENLVLDGKAPTLLYGYGGFEVSLTPAYSGLVGSGWLERGGVYAIANIRGGGEFGPKWHQAALKEKRHRAYEDFAAVSEDLVTRKVTTAAHLGIRGGSNGGLLMGNMFTLYPQLYKAVVCQVPLLDMQRYHKLLAGASWMGEYGDPDKPEEWKFIQTFSPYHNAKKEAKYPRILFTTSTRDDRVHPGHARKMVARMKEFKHDVLYYENIEGGHGGAADNKQKAFMESLTYTFLARQLGLNP